MFCCSNHHHFRWDPAGGKGSCGSQTKSLSAAEQDIPFFHAEGRVEKEFVDFVE